MTLDDLIQELQSLRTMAGGDTEVVMYHVNSHGATDIDEAPIIYKGYFMGKMGRDVACIALGHPENDFTATNWEPYMERLNVIRFTTAYQEDQGE